MGLPKELKGMLSSKKIYLPVRIAKKELLKTIKDFDQRFHDVSPQKTKNGWTIVLTFDEVDKPASLRLSKSDEGTTTLDVLLPFYPIRILPVNRSTESHVQEEMRKHTYESVPSSIPIGYEYNDKNEKIWMKFAQPHLFLDRKHKLEKLINKFIDQVRENPIYIRSLNDLIDLITVDEVEKEIALQYLAGVPIKEMTFSDGEHFEEKTILNKLSILRQRSREKLGYSILPYRRTDLIEDAGYPFFPGI
jgi:hypothetical protein